MKLTESQQKALRIIANWTYEHPITAKFFAELMWPDNVMHRAVKNTGNGACAGKGAWLCAGSYMGKLISKGWVMRGYDARGYCLTNSGKEVYNKNK